MMPISFSRGSRSLAYSRLLSVLKYLIFNSISFSIRLRRSLNAFRMVSEFLLEVDLIQHQCMKLSKNVIMYFELPFDCGYWLQRFECSCLSFRFVYWIIGLLGLFCVYADIAC